MPPAPHLNTPLSQSTAFSQVSIDQAIEKTVNQDTKTNGGIIGFSRNPATVTRWMVNAHHRADITGGIKKMAGLDWPAANLTAVHKKCRQSSIKEKEEADQTVLSTIDTFHNPFHRTK